MAAKRPRRSTKSDSSSLTVDQFAPLEDQRYALPQLVLSVVIPDVAFRNEGLYQPLRFKSGRQWIKMAHAGYRIGTILTPRNGIIADGVDMLAQQWREHDRRSLDALIAFRGQLKGLFGADCNDSYRALVPGYYPIDVGYVSFLASDSFPAQLDDLVDWRSGIERAASGGKWCLGVLGETRSEWA